MRQLVLFLSLILMTQQSFAVNYGREAKQAKNARTGETIRYWGPTYLVTQFIFEYCDLKTVVIVPSEGDPRKHDIGVVCEKK